VEQLLAPGLLGREKPARRGPLAAHVEETLLHGRSGSVMRAISILDCALWDLNSRRRNFRFMYLGAVLDEAVPAYASGGYYLPGKTPKKLGGGNGGLPQSRFSCVKMKVGRLSPRKRSARKKLRATRSGRRRLDVGCEQRLARFADRDAYMERFELYDPYWIEEPFFPR